MVDRVGQQLGNYQLVSLLGQGGYAEVYLGQHVRFKQQAAIKVLCAQLSSAEAEHFQHEAETIAQLSHPAIIRVLDFDVQDGVPFLVIEYAQGGSLRQRYPKGSQVPLPQIVTYVQQVADALQYAHDQKLIHRDIKPENMLLGRRQELLLSDFGIATVAHSSGSLSTKEAVGTLAYMAPEQIEGHPREASDQYALGCVVYEWLCGERPFDGSPTEVMVQQLSMPPPPLQGRVDTISPSIEQVVLRALAKDPRARYPSVHDFAAALEQASLPAASSHVPLAGQATQPPAEQPWNVPFARNAYFTGRGQLLARLHEQLFSGQRAALTQSAALSGLGGIGKTQTAIEYAYRYRQEYRAVLWVRADSRDTLLADYVAIARLLSLPGHEAEVQLAVVSAVKRWLQEQQGWLLILDNADDLSRLPDFLPPLGSGHLLLTTRAQATGKVARSLSVEKLASSESLRLLLHRAKLLAEGEPLETVSAAERKAAHKLVTELDGLPLALDQAGAYIEETECSLSDYLTLYTRRRLALLRRGSQLTSDYPHSVASTWALSFVQVEQADPAAADLLRLCAFLHPDAIPEAILTQGATELGSRLQEVVEDPLLWNEAIQLLRRYSLVKRDAEARLLNLHRLVQVVLKESLDEATRRQWAERAVRAVSQAFPAEEHLSWERCDPLLPHVVLCAELIEQFGFSFPEAAHLLHATGSYLIDRDRYDPAERLFQQALALRVHTLGAEHVDTFATLNRLAFLFTLSGDYQQAEDLVTPSLAAAERVLGPEHPQVASALRNLGTVYMYTGRYGQAEALLQQALAIREQAVGSTPDLVSQHLNGLALLYQFQGQYARAEPLFQRALTHYEQASGPEHLDTLTLTANLAVLYSDQGKYAQAETLLQSTLTIGERVLGSENAFTQYLLLSLGQLATRRGQYQQADALLRQAQLLGERVLGPENEWTQRALLFQANLSEAQQHDDQAAALYQQAFTGFEQALGPRHPRVAEALTGLARLATRQGNYAQAASFLERALAIDEQVLGPQHPQTAAALDAQGYLALLQGREEQAASLLQRALALQEQSLGASHPDVAKSLSHLARLYQQQGQYEQAHSCSQRALAIREQALDPEHTDNFATQATLLKRDDATHSP
jgi:tetratricopeptide (TPR) repeat protein